MLRGPSEETPKRKHSLESVNIVVVSHRTVPTKEELLSLQSTVAHTIHRRDRRRHVLRPVLKGTPPAARHALYETCSKTIIPRRHAKMRYEHLVDAGTERDWGGISGRSDEKKTVSMVRRRWYQW